MPDILARIPIPRCFYHALPEGKPGKPLIAVNNFGEGANFTAGMAQEGTALNQSLTMKAAISA